MMQQYEDWSEECESAFFLPTKKVLFEASQLIFRAFLEL